MKTIARLAFVLIYILAVILSALLAFKPGSAFFYTQITLKKEDCVLDEGFAYRCPVSLSPILFPPGRVLLYEDGRQLYSDHRHQVSGVGNGCFNATVTQSGDYSIFFAPLGNTNPLTNAKSYRAYFSFVLFTHTMGILSLGLLLPGLLGFFGFALGQVKSRNDLRRLPQETLQLVARYLAQKRALIAGICLDAKSNRHAYLWRWAKLGVETVAAAYGLVFIEWIFQVTGPTFLAEMSLGQKLGGFLLTALFLAGLALILLTALFALSLALRLIHLGWVAFLIALGAPTALLVMAIVLWVENFTYVLFHFGILTSTGLLRAAYGVLIGVAFVSYYWQRLKSSRPGKADDPFTGNLRWLSGITIGLVCISSAAALLNFGPNSQTSALARLVEPSTLRRPNILLIGSDGLSASHMSIYGYERDTTPNLRALGSTSLVVENAFANANSTLGSLVSLFTSKLPIQTRVINPPDILQGADAYEHLPGFLSAAGYTTVEIGVKKYVDANTMNVQNGFDVVNQRSLQNDPLVKAWRDAGYKLSALLIGSFEEKLADRIWHAFYIDSIANPFKVVTQPVSWRDDLKRKDQLLALLDQNRGPVFAHVHFMGTHGGRFIIEEPKYSLGKIQDKSWMADFYDDSILAFDRSIGEIIEYLKTSGQYDHTLLIIYSDHPMHSNILERIPLIMHFPGDQFAGKVSTNIQNLDIAPTLLDYMGQEIPDWMSGRSLLSVDPGQDRLIFSTIKTVEIPEDNDQGQADVSRGVAPFYRVKSIQVVACNHWYRLNLWTQEWSSGPVDRHTAPCAESDLPSLAELKQSIIELLAGQGYDVSSLR